MEVLASSKVRWSDGRVLEPPGEKDRVYSRFNLSMEGLDDQIWKDPVEGIRGLKKPGVIKVPLLYIDISQVKSKDIGKICTVVGRSQRWFLLEWGRMNPSELTKFFCRMENDVRFRKFYGGIYDGLRLTGCNSLEEKTESLKKSGAETRMRRKRMVWFYKLSSDWEL